MITKQFVYFRLQSIMKRYSCADNPRVAQVGNISELREYVKARNNGCCGFYDQKHLLGGKWYWMGFNYGH